MTEVIKPRPEVAVALRARLDHAVDGAELGTGSEAVSVATRGAAPLASSSSSRSQLSTRTASPIVSLTCEAPSGDVRRCAWLSLVIVTHLVTRPSACNAAQPRGSGRDGGLSAARARPTASARSASRSPAIIAIFAVSNGSASFSVRSGLSSRMVSSATMMAFMAIKRPATWPCISLIRS